MKVVAGAGSEEAPLTDTSRLQAGLGQDVLREEGLGGETLYAFDQGKGAVPTRSEPIGYEPNNTMAGNQPKGEATLRHLQGTPSGRPGQEALPNQVRLEIHEPDLGRMHWNLMMDEGRVMAKAMVDTSRLQELLQSNQNVLQSGLQEAGLEMEGFDVWVGSGSRGFSSSPGETPSGTRRGVSEKGSEPTDSKTDSRKQEAGGDSSSHGLDLFA